MPPKSNDGAQLIVKKRKSHGGHGHHGGSWKVAYADFVTAMMAFFMVMWIMGLSDQTRAQIQGYFNDPLGFVKNQPMTRNVITLPGTPQAKPGRDQSEGTGSKQTEAQRAQQLAEQVRRTIQQDRADLSAEMLQDVQVTVTAEGVQLQFTERKGPVFFSLGSAELLPPAERLIRKLSPVLARAGRKMIIDGYTDARPYPSSSYTNWDLSGDRAAAIRRALVAGGVSERQFDMVRANADTRPLHPDDPYNAENRRVTILLPYRVSDAEAKGLPSDEMRDKLRQTFRPEGSGGAPLPGFNSPASK